MNRQPRPVRRPARPAPPSGNGAEVTFTALIGFAACVKCGAIVVDAPASRKQHAEFHLALRLLWNGRQQT